MRLGTRTTICFLTFLWTLSEGLVVNLQPAWVPYNISGNDLLTADGDGENCIQHYCAMAANISLCKCDDQCWKRRDCCLDFWQAPSWSEKGSILDILSDKDQLVFWGDNASCSAHSDRTKLPHSSFTYLVVSSCPETTAPFTASLCEPNVTKRNSDRWLQVPVYSHDTGSTYKNLCYAACNKDATNISIWTTTLHCPMSSSAETLAEGSSDPRCFLDFQVPNALDGSPSIIECSSSGSRVRSTCDPTWEVPGDPNATRQIRRLCRTIAAKVAVDRKTYSNIYCAICNRVGQSLPTTATCIKHIWMCNPELCPKKIRDVQTKNFAILFDTDYWSKGQILGVERHCTSGKLYDPFRQQCRPIFCGEGYEYHEGRCRGVPTEVPTAALSRLDPACPRIRLDVNDSDVKVDADGTLAIGVTGERYEPGRYEHNNGTVVVCADLGQNYVAEFPQSAFQIVTMVGSALSLVALGFKMVIFVLLPETRSFPERIVFSLSASLFVGQLLFTVAVTDSSRYVVCASVAIVTHYAFLATFCWMTVLAFDVWQTFANMEARSATHGKSKQHFKFLRYSLFAWLSPLAIVIVASACEWSAALLPATSPLRPYYGHALCWISSRPALLLYFVAPIGLLLGANLILFGLTSWNICASSRQTSVAQNASRNSVGSRKTTAAQRAHHLRFCLYLRLGAILGLTWISGFIAAYADQVALWYCFVVLNTLQGVYILLAFTSFRKVKHCLQRHLRHPPYYGRMRGGPGQYENGHQPLQRSSTQSSQTTTISGGSTQRTSVFSTMSVT